MAQESKLSLDQLVTHFEGLGDNCEFGLVQRLCGAEPLGLFRFIGAGLASMIDVVETGGSHLYTAEDINLYYVEGAGEYMLDSRHYSDFQCHTFISSATYDLEKMRYKRIKILSYLKRRLFEEMKNSEKIFVRKGGESIVELKRLHGALNKHAKNTLLCVAEADNDHEAGTIEKIDDGLWRGYLRYFKRFPLDEPIDILSWVKILKRMYEVVNPGSRFQQSRRLACGRTMLPPFQVAAAVTFPDEPPSVHLRVLRDCEHMQTIASKEIEVSVEPQTMIVFSARIRIEGDLRGSRLDIRLDNLPLDHAQFADLARRGVWQTIFGISTVPAGYRGGTLVIKATISSGSSLSIDGWAVETGPVPGLDEKPFSRQDIKRRGLELFRHQRSRVTRLLAKSDTGNILHASTRAMERRSFIAADDMLAMALAAAPGDLALLKQYAFSAHNSGRHVTAITRWQQALSAAPQDPMCHAGLACNFREFGELRVATNLIDTALRRFPDDGMILTEAARIASAGKRFDEAVVFLEKAIAIHGPLENLTSARDCAKTNAEAARPL